MAASLYPSSPPDSVGTTGACHYSRPGGSSALELGTVRGLEVGLPTHFHNEDQTTFVLSGSRRFIIGDELVDVGPDEGARIPASLPHLLLAETSELFCINICASPDECSPHGLSRRTRPIERMLMYQPHVFREERLEILHSFIRDHPLATLITAGSGGLLANLVPFTLVDGGEKGTLRAHVAKPNDQVDALRSGAETLVVFQGLDAYITPSWYVSKREHGRVVPTWNYTVVQARGTPRVIDDPDWLRAQIQDLTAAQEQRRLTPWTVSDAPEPFISGQIKTIIGIEIPISAIEGKWKVSQNRSAADRQSVEEGLRKEGINEEMAKLVAQRGALLEQED